MAVAGGKDLLDVEMQIRKRCQIDLEELARAFVSPENGAGNASDSHVVFVSSRLTKPSTSCAFHAAKISRAM
jgi:hypothetical protein